MIFRKKKRMVDVRELQRRGVVRIPKDEIKIPRNKEGFIEVGNKLTSESISNSELFGFMDTVSPERKTFPTESEGYNKREVDEKITSLDNKIYRLENRMEVLEKKLNIGQSSTNASVMGW